MKNDSLIYRLQEFLEEEARSGSMDFGCITPMYGYRMCGRTAALDVIAEALIEAKIKLYDR